MAESIKSQKNKSRNKLVTDISSVKRVRRLSKKAFGIHSQKSLLANFFAATWRMIFAGLISLWAISGISPFELIDRNIMASVEKISTVNFYAGSADGQAINKNLSIGQPQLKKGDYAFYSRENSAVIDANQMRQIFLSGFSADSVNDIDEDENSDAGAGGLIESDSQINETKTDPPLPSPADSIEVSRSEEESDEELPNEDKGFDSLEEDLGNNQDDPGDNLDEEDSGLDSNFIGPRTEEAVPNNDYDDSDKSSQTDDVEVIDSDSGEVGVFDLAGDELVAGVFDKVKGLFGTMKAWAEHEESLLDKRYGKFKSARIGLSMNMKLIPFEATPIGVSEEKQTNDDIQPEPDAALETDSIIDAQTEEESQSPSIDSANSSADPDATEVNGDGSAGVIMEDFNTEQESASAPEPISVQTLRTLRDYFQVFNASAQDESEQGTIELWYSLGDQVWQKLGSINQKDAELQNYFYFDADGLGDWEDIEHLSLKIEAVVSESQTFTAYLDSAWAEVSYESLGSEISELVIEFLSENDVVKLNETGRLRFRYNKMNQGIISRLAENTGLVGFWDKVKLAAVLKDSEGKNIDLPISIIFEENGEFTLILPEDRQLMPGKYTIEFSIEDAGEEKVITTKDFSWGVLAVNFNKSVYRPEEKVFLQMAVLDSAGHTICDADARLDISAPDGTVKSYFTSDSSIASNPLCDSNSVISSPDYSAYFDTGTEGIYRIKFSADLGNGVKEITDSFEVMIGSAFDVERVGPTRIYPKADYEMKILVTPVEDFKGDISEVVPIGFKIPNYTLEITNNNDSDPFGAGYFYDFLEGDVEKKLVWHDVEIGAGETLEIIYSFDAPDVSPELYAIGPLVAQFDSQQMSISNRKWQIASDAVLKRAKTVMFMAGTWNEAAAGTGRNTNNDYVLPAFNWKLAETGVQIRNAYIVSEMQFEAYNATGLNYTGYRLGFDACAGSSCASAFGSGGGQVLDNNSNILAYDENESEIVKLQLDVTNEAQVAAYTGGGTVMESQFGYHLKNPTTKASIANTSAILVVTYTYDYDAPSLTNTVIYPLDSTNGTDIGSRQAVLATGCTADGTCPVFGYNMQIPEWQGMATSTNRVSQWFKFFAVNDASVQVDLRPYLDIQTINVDSSPFHFESFNSGNGNLPNMYFPDWSNSGFAENSNQQTEFFINNPSNTYMIGGEVVETYLASSSATVKTRTVSFPIGVITNGNTTALSSKSVTVFFPENGSATGTVDVKSAWLRVHSNSTSGTTYTVTVSSNVGDNATSTNQVYSHNATVQVIKPQLDMIYIIPSTNYTELESANAVIGKGIKANITYNNAIFGGASAELMITYSYSEEGKGYLSNLSLFGGQMSATTSTSTIQTVANTVFPEQTGKTLYAAGLTVEYLSSNNTGTMGSNPLYLDANLASTNPLCNPVYYGRSNGNNSYYQLVKDVNDVMSTTDNQSYQACYAGDDTSLATDGAKMNGQLVYTYGWTNSAPAGTFITASTTAKRDGTGVVDIGIEIDDPDDHDVRAKLEFATGTSCVFAPSGDPQIDEADGSIFADFGDPYVENDEEYQIGTANGYVKTASGSNSVFIDWQTSDSLGSVEGDYCLRLTANDMNLSQATSATTTIYVDTLKPTAPGALSLNSRTGSSITLNYGATTTETNFYQYIIYYQAFDGSDPTETDSVFGSTSDANLLSKTFGDKATTTVTLPPGKQVYSFAIWVYDQHGNKASSSRVDISTNDAPVGWWNMSAMPAQKTDGSGKVDISIRASDLNQDGVKARVDYVSGGSCDFTEPQDPYLDPISISADYGTPQIDNDWPYQVGTSTNLITTNLENTVSFDWLTRPYLDSADGTYCLQLSLRDDLDDQLIATTTTLTIDNVAPQATASLGFEDITINSVRLVYASTTPGSDSNEPATNAYKIFYRSNTSGVTESDWEKDSGDLDNYNYGGATSTIVTGLSSNTWYFFKIWTYDAFGNKASSTETSVKTYATIRNDSLTFSNSLVYGPVLNIAAAGPGNIWNFRAVVSETNGWLAIASTTLRLADYSDNSAPYDDLIFYWDQSANEFYEIGTDSLNAAAISPASASDCTGNICTLDFKIVFNKTFRSTSTVYSASVYSANDSGVWDEDPYADLYQVRFPTVRQIHYRWRNDDGGE